MRTTYVPGQGSPSQESKPQSRLGKIAEKSYKGQTEHKVEKAVEVRGVEKDVAEEVAKSSPLGDAVIDAFIAMKGISEDSMVSKVEQSLVNKADATANSTLGKAPKNQVAKGVKTPEKKGKSKSDKPSKPPKKKKSLAARVLLIVGILLVVLIAVVFIVILGQRGFNLTQLGIQNVCYIDVDNITSKIITTYW